MILKSFIDSESLSTTATTTRLRFSATVNALEYYGLRIWDESGVERDEHWLSERDAAAIRELLVDAVAEQRRVHMEDCRYLRGETA
jgi:hypothetical protein